MCEVDEPYFFLTSFSTLPFPLSGSDLLPTLRGLTPDALRLLRNVVPPLGLVRKRLFTTKISVL